MHSLTIALCFCFLVDYISTEDTEEPICLSKFDYDIKVLRTMARLEESDVQLSETTKILQNEVQGIKTSIDASPPTVAFMAQLSAHVNIPSTGETHYPIIFDDVITNEGDAYNKYTGGFTAPADGIYQFNLEISIPNGSPGQVFHVVLEKNKEKAGYIFFVVDEHLWLRKTTSVIHHLRQGDTILPVVVLSTGSSPNVIGGLDYHSHFSGFRIGR